MHTRSSLLSLLGFFLTLAALPLRGAEATFAGEWETTYGHMTLKADGAKIRGTYRYAGGTENEIRGTQAGRKLTFSYSEQSVSGAGEFTMSEDGTTFTGKWRSEGTERWNPWSGRRSVAELRDFSGVWKTSFGLMRLVQKGAKVEGCYTYGGTSTVQGTVAGDVLTLTYREPTGTEGTAVFTLGAEHTEFSGTWKTKDGGGGEWSGTRVEPQAGRVWLVVLEARWETSLREPEYSYGEMLRQFFSRVPTVAVRHRYFTGRADFAKWCAELPYLNEPVVFYISSHGSEKGITVGGEVLDGAFIGRQLRYAPDVKLVHLGSCLTMAGTVPAEIQKASELGVPVSGYTRTADWAGSAVIDFAYLELVLSRKMAPGEAVKQMQDNVSFAGEREKAGCAIAPAGLKIVEGK